jgi:lysophospholipase L1-like esterase
VRIAFFGDSLTSGIPGSSYFALLRRQFPDDTLLNYGRGNDTVVSLYRRISAMQFGEPLDLAFLWVGVNDVPRSDRWPFRVFNTLIGQRRARDLAEFRACYMATLDLLCDNAKHVIVAPPVLRGENLASRPNRCLEALAESIEEVTAGYTQVEFLNLRAIFAGELAGRPISDYVLGNPFRVLLDALTLRTDERIDTKAAARGLHLTLDGVHLNSAGARLVAEELTRIVGKGRAAPEPTE